MNQNRHTSTTDTDLTVTQYLKEHSRPTLEKQEQLHSAGHAIRGKSAGTHAACAFFYKQMHKKKMFDLENEGQRHGVQHSSWCHSMAKINLCKSYTSTFLTSSHRF